MKYIGYVGFDKKTNETIFVHKSLIKAKKLKKIYEKLGLKVGIRKIPKKYHKYISAWL